MVARRGRDATLVVVGCLPRACYQFTHPRRSGGRGHGNVRAVGDGDGSRDVDARPAASGNRAYGRAAPQPHATRDSHAVAHAYHHAITDATAHGHQSVATNTGSPAADVRAPLADAARDRRRAQFATERLF